MGYTHYWRTSRRIDADDWRAIVTDAKKVIADQGRVLAFEEGDEREPQADHEAIRFNGSDKGHETFMLTPEATDFEFCKTARKPYDLAVCAVLLITVKHTGAVKVTSDGDWDDEWRAPAEYVKRLLGYTDEDIAPAKRTISREED
jgi:hypothetical protein